MTNQVFKILGLLTSVIFIFSSAVFAEPVVPKKIRVLIDPGHGGEDNGANHQNVKEKNLVLNVALELRKLLNQDPAFETILTRDHDVFIPLDSRSEMARQTKADVFISIHANSSPEKKARGTEFYFENQNATDEDSLMLANRENAVREEKTDGVNKDNPDLSSILSDLAHSEHMMMSHELAQHLLKSFQKGLAIKTRAIRQAPFRVLSVPMPATLVELGFISNPSEAAWLAESRTQSAMAKAIFQGLQTFKEKLDKIRPAPVK